MESLRILRLAVRATRVRPAHSSGRERAGTGAMATIVYKITGTDEWRAACDAGVFVGAPVDLADGFIHFSTPEQAAETAARHFAGRGDLLLVALDADAFGPALVWEPSRGGALFPHLYGTFDPEAALWVRPLPLGPDGRHLFPEIAP